MEANTQEKYKILMLDDEKFLLDIYRISFEKNGYEVVMCNRADDALNLLRSGYAPEVILFDVTMPDSKSGYEFIEDVTKEGLAKGAVKVALTNEGRDGAKERLVELGMDAYLQKVQYIPSEVVAEVTKLLGARK